MEQKLFLLWGMDNNGDPINDAWVLDVHTKAWSQVQTHYILQIQHIMLHPVCQLPHTSRWCSTLLLRPGATARVCWWWESVVHDGLSPSHSRGG